MRYRHDSQRRDTRILFINEKYRKTNQWYVNEKKKFLNDRKTKFKMETNIKQVLIMLVTNDKITTDRIAPTAKNHFVLSLK